MRPRRRSQRRRGGWRERVEAVANATDRKLIGTAEYDGPCCVMLSPDECQHVRDVLAVADELRLALAPTVGEH